MSSLKLGRMVTVSEVLNLPPMAAMLGRVSPSTFQMSPFSRSSTMRGARSRNLGSTVLVQRSPGSQMCESADISRVVRAGAALGEVATVAMPSYLQPKVHGHYGDHDQVRQEGSGPA